LARVFLSDASGRSQEARSLLGAAASLGHVFAKRDLAFLLIRGRSGFKSNLSGFAMYVAAIRDAFVVVVRDPQPWNERLL
jgi:hypothetical protein